MQVLETGLLRFVNSEANAVRLEVVITRETLPNGAEHITITPMGMEGEPLYKFFRNPRKVPNGEGTPKHTGGKKPYIMLMVDEVERLRSHGVANVEELIGYLVCLGRYVEWGTGRLVRKRSKKALRYRDLQSLFPCGNRKLNRVLAELKEHDLLFSSQEGYFVSPRLIKKGKAEKRGGR